MKFLFVVFVFALSIDSVAGVADSVILLLVSVCETTVLFLLECATLSGEGDAVAVVSEEVEEVDRDEVAVRGGLSTFLPVEINKITMNNTKQAAVPSVVCNG